MRVRGDPSSSLGPGGDGGRPSAQHHWIPAFAGMTIWAGHAVTAVASVGAKETRGSSRA